MMQANIFGIPKPENIALHRRFLKFLRFLDKPRSSTALTREILEIQEIYDAGKYNIFWFMDLNNIGLHHEFLKFLRYPG